MTTWLLGTKRRPSSVNHDDPRWEYSTGGADMAVYKKRSCTVMRAPVLHCINWHLDYNCSRPHSALGNLKGAANNYERSITASAMPAPTRNAPIGRRQAFGKSLSGRSPPMTKPAVTLATKIPMPSSNRIRLSFHSRMRPSLVRIDEASKTLHCFYSCGWRILAHAASGI